MPGRLHQAAPPPHLCLQLPSRTHHLARLETRSLRRPRLLEEFLATLLATEPCSLESQAPWIAFKISRVLHVWAFVFQGCFSGGDGRTAHVVWMKRTFAAPKCAAERRRNNNCVMQQQPWGPNERLGSLRELGEAAKVRPGASALVFQAQGSLLPGNHIA